MKSGEDQLSVAPSQVYRNLFRDKYISSQYIFVQFLVEHLTDLCRVFEADLQSVLVLAIVGQMALKTAFREGYPEEGTTPSDFVADSINALSIAEISGIPRETVRRKLAGLAKRGWVVRGPNGSWRIAADGEASTPARRELFDLEQRSIERIARFLGQIQGLVEASREKTRNISTPTV